MRNRLLFLLILGCLWSPELLAGQIGVSFKDTVMLRGSTAYIPVRIDSSLTGLNVFSYELDISYTSSTVLIDSVATSGSMTAAWSTLSYHLTSGRITISGAGISALAGTGNLVYLRLKLPISGAGGYASLTFNKALFNEGTPTTTLRNATISITDLPKITVTPDNATLTVGETQAFTVSGATAPIAWTTTNAAVATITSGGILTGVTPGFCEVVAVDNNGLRDTNNQVEVRACRISMRDTTYRQGQTLLIPIYISNLSAVDIFSGSLQLTYNTNVLTATGVSKTGSLLGAFGGNPAFDVNGGTISISFANATRLNGVGQQVLVYVQFLVTSLNTYGTVLVPGNILFNENILATSTNGTFTPISTSSLSVSPATAILVAGDSLQCTATGGAVPPLEWSVSNPSLATISSTGMLKALAGGTIQVNVIDANSNKGKSGDFVLYDIRFQLPTINSAAGFYVDQTFLLDGFPAGIYSAQFSVNFNSTYFTPISASTVGTLSSAWAMAFENPSSGVVRIAGASASPITTAGILVKVRFKIADNTPNGSFTFTVSNTVLNEGNPLPLVTNGSIVISPTAVTQNLLTGWNMISVPLNIADMRKTTLYPTATTKAYAYNGVYSTPDTLQNRVGYWLKFVGAQVTALSGAPRSRDTITVRSSGWNMIGSVAYPIPKTAIVYNPPANTLSPYYTYFAGSGYKTQDTIKPGVGYWVKTMNAGNLILDFANVVPENVGKPATTLSTDGMNELTFAQRFPSDRVGDPARLYFGERPATSRSMEEFELPPVPPPGSFDVRFGTNRYAEEFPAGSGELPIAVQSEGNPLIISWNMKSSPAIPYSLVEKRDGKIISVRKLVSEGSFEVMDPQGLSLSVRRSGEPTSFSIGQNYPNPFNPVTNFEIQIPGNSGADGSPSGGMFVTLAIYDVVGRQVGVVVNEVLVPGEYRVSWDGSKLSSGVYYYRLTGGTFSETRKMLLMR